MFRTRLLFIFALLLLWSEGFAQEYRYTFQYVWSPDSAKIYIEPSDTSKVITKIPYGERVHIAEVLDSIKTIPAFHVSDTFKAERLPPAHWLQVKLKGESGYVKNDQLGILPPFNRTKYGVEPAEEFLERTFGKLNKVEKKVPFQLNGSNFTASVDSISFGNGIYKTERMFDGCIDYRYRLIGFSFYQAVNMLYLTTYHEMVINIGPPGKSTFKREGYGISFSGKEGDTYYFDGAFSAQEVFLRKLYETEYLLGFYYCT